MFPKAPKPFAAGASSDAPSSASTAEASSSEAALGEPSEGFLKEDSPPKTAPAQAPLGRPGPHTDSKPSNPFSTKTLTQEVQQSATQMPRSEFPASAASATSSAPSSSSQSVTTSAPSTASAESKPSSSSSTPVHSGMPQLVLRALFGVTKELTREEIIEHASKLQGVKKIGEIKREESRAFQTMTESLSQVGFGSASEMVFKTPAGEIDFVEESGITLAVLREGDYPAGVRETLMIVARELAILK